MASLIVRLIFSAIVLLVSVTLHAHGKKRHSSAAPKPDLESILLTTSTPADLEVCFSPEEHCDAKLIKFIQSAHESLDIAIYDLNHEQLVHQILLQSKKLHVRVLVDQRQAKESKSLVSLLSKAGVEVRFGHQRGIMHNKFVIVDDKMIETGSFNYTNHATLANNENQIYLANPSVVKRYHERFQKIWSDGKIFGGERKLSSDSI